MEFSAKLFKDAGLEFAPLFNELQIEIAVLSMQRTPCVHRQEQIWLLRINNYMYVGIHIYKRFCEF